MTEDGQRKADTGCTRFSVDSESIELLEAESRGVVSGGWGWRTEGGVGPRAQATSNHMDNLGAFSMAAVVNHAVSCACKRISKVLIPPRFLEGNCVRQRGVQ